LLLVVLDAAFASLPQFVIVLPIFFSTIARVEAGRWQGIDPRPLMHEDPDAGVGEALSALRRRPA
jgi:hypothetical protein